VTEQRRSWGVVLHTNPILDLFDYQLPKGLDLSLTYNDSNSFRPSDVGFDIMGNKLPAPSGTTREKGFLISTLDNKVSLRVTWYKTIQKNTSLNDPTGMVFWAKAGVARTINAMAQEAWGIKNKNQTTPECGAGRAPSPAPCGHSRRSLLRRPRNDQSGHRNALPVALPRRR
jgi:hypothetical protein